MSLTPPQTLKPASLHGVQLTCTVLSLLGVLCLSGFSSQARASDGKWEIGALGGWTLNSEDESFNQYDVMVNYRLPWSWNWGGVIDVSTRLTGTVGALRGGGETGVICTLGFGFVFGKEGGRLEVLAGSALTLMSRYEYGNEDFGGPFAVTNHIGILYRFIDNLSAIARLQHTSNAGIYSENPGLNLVMLGLRYAF